MGVAVAVSPPDPPNDMPTATNRSDPSVFSTLHHIDEQAPLPIDAGLRKRDLFYWASDESSRGPARVECVEPIIRPEKSWPDCQGPSVEPLGRRHNIDGQRW